MPLIDKVLVPSISTFETRLPDHCAELLRDLKLAIRERLIAVGMPVTRHPCTDPDVRHYPIRLLPWVRDGKLHWTTESNPTAGWPYMRLRLRHARPALRPVRVTWPPVPLGHRPSLHPLRCPSWRIVRGLLRYYV